MLAILIAAAVYATTVGGLYSYARWRRVPMFLLPRGGRIGWREFLLLPTATLGLALLLAAIYLHDGQLFIVGAGVNALGLGPYLGIRHSLGY